MPSTNWKRPTVGQNVTGEGGTDSWTNVSDATVKDGIFADVESGMGASPGNETETLYVSGFNFSSDIPAGSTIDGVEVRFFWKDGSDNSKEISTKLKTSSTTSSDKTKDEDIPNTAGYSTVYGGSSDKWGLSLTRSTVVNSSFGVYLRCGYVSEFSGHTPEVDTVEVKVHYSDNSQNLTLQSNRFVLRRSSLSISKGISILPGSQDIELKNRNLIIDNPVVLPSKKIPLEISSGIEIVNDGGIVAPSQKIAYKQSLDPFVNFGIDAPSQKIKFIPSAELSFGRNLEVPSLKIKFDIGKIRSEYTVNVESSRSLIIRYIANLHSAQSVVPSSTKFISLIPNRNIIYGTSSGPFKLNMCSESTCIRNVVHTGKAKPSIIEVIANFKLLSPFMNLKAGDFIFETHEGYLRIENIESTGLLISKDESDTAEIDITPTIYSYDNYSNIPLKNVPV